MSVFFSPLNFASLSWETFFFTNPSHFPYLLSEDALLEDLRPILQSAPACCAVLLPSQQLGLLVAESSITVTHTSIVLSFLASLVSSPASLYALEQVGIHSMSQTTGGHCMSAATLGSSSSAITIEPAIKDLSSPVIDYP